MQGPIHHAISEIPHANFTPQIHNNLYLNLNNLPLNEEMRTLYPFGIPIFLHTALDVLANAALTQDPDVTVSIDTQITYTNIRKPTPPHPDCLICRIVDWIITSCPNPHECRTRLQSLNLITIFEVNRELWCRILPKPLLVDEVVLIYAEMIDYPRALTDTNFFSPLQGSVGKIR
ncbi:hypothetical protein Aperf_G00000123646 [Anoplocephala perfoliata]